MLTPVSKNLFNVTLINANIPTSMIVVAGDTSKQNNILQKEILGLKNKKRIYNSFRGKFLADEKDHTSVYRFSINAVRRYFLIIDLSFVFQVRRVAKVVLD